MDALDAILNRRSVRVFKEDPVDGKDLEKILKSGLAGPSACNRRPVELIVIEDKAVMASLLPKRLEYSCCYLHLHHTDMGIDELTYHNPIQN